jgi:outer membrane protein
MRRLVVFFLILFTATGLHAQKVGYVDTDFILEKIPEYQEAQQRLNEMSQEWQKQVDRKYEEIGKMYKDLEAEEILLTDDMRRKREAEINKKEQEALDFQKKKFGIEGDLFKERQKLVKPIQDKVYEAVKEVAKAGGFVIMMDKSGSTTLIYTNSKYNKSKAVLKKLGYDIDDEE